MPQPLFSQATIIGLGLIGSSLARGLRAQGLASVIVAVDANELALEYGRQQHIIDRATTDPAAGVQGSDLILIATPTEYLADLVTAIVPHVSPGCLVMDTGSVKQRPLEVMQHAFPEGVLVVPAHPIAGSEHSGIRAGRADLFDKKRVIITPDAPLPASELQRITALWGALGARVEAMPAALHDRIYAYVSHLPQLLAFAAAPLIQASDAEKSADERLRRFLRISTSDPDLWNGIFVLNHIVIREALDRYLDVIDHIRRELLSAPPEVPSQEGDLVRLVLFPRIVASCLITTVMEAEKNAGLAFMRFSGNGFADMTAPATSPPEEDIEHIAQYHAPLANMLGQLKQRLQELCC